MLPLQGMGVRFLVEGLKIHVPCGAGKKKEKKKIFRKRQKREKRREKEEERQRVSGNVSFLPVTDRTWRLSLPPSWEVRWRQ